MTDSRNQATLRRSERERLKRSVEACLLEVENQIKRSSVLIANAEDNLIGVDDADSGEQS